MVRQRLDKQMDRDAFMGLIKSENKGKWEPLFPVQQPAVRAKISAILRMFMFHPKQYYS